MYTRELPRGGSYGNINYNTLQIAKIKQVEDQAHSGKIKVWLMNSHTDETDEDNWVTIRYASPLAGVSNPDNADPQAIQSTGQRAYGFFAVPPDSENVVLVSFANGQPDQGFYISGVYGDTMTANIPGNGTSPTYNGDKPSLEVNRYSQQISSPETTPTRPEDTEFTGRLEAQGITDKELGAGDQTVWRDKAPTVMGWLSPSGHSIAMDDKSKSLRIRSAGGAQVFMASGGDVFIINNSGNGFIRMGNGGEFDVYGSVGVNIFAGTTVNIKSTDINIEGTNINIKGETTNIESTTLNLKGTTVNIQGDTSNLKGQTTNVEGGTLNLKGSINSSFINGDVAYANTAGGAPPGSPNPVGDTAGSAGDAAGAGTVTRTPTRGGNAS